MNSVHKKIAEVIKKHTFEYPSLSINPEVIKDIADILEEENIEFRRTWGKYTKPFSKTQFIKTAGCKE